MSSNSLTICYEGGDLLLAVAACAGGRAAARSLREQAVGGSLSGLASQFQWRERVRGDYTLRAIQIDAFTFTLVVTRWSPDPVNTWMGDSLRADTTSSYLTKPAT